MCQGSSHDVQARLFFPLLFPPPDIKTLFYAENERRQAAGGQEAALTVNIPQWCELETNYRTHQGILDSAALMVVSPGRGFIRGRGRIGMSRRGGLPLLLRQGDTFICGMTSRLIVSTAAGVHIKDWGWSTGT